MRRSRMVGGAFVVEVWMAGITPLLEEKKALFYYQQLPPYRKQKADRQLVPLKRAQSIGVWALWAKVKEEHGYTEEYVYNFSHSGEYVICAVETSGCKKVKLGCDIEKIRDYNHKLPERFFCESEVKRLKEEPSVQGRKELFCRFWVLKESYLKATREGMKLDTRSFEIKLGSPSVLLKQPKEHFDYYHLCEIDFEDKEYRIGVCTTGIKINNTLRKLLL